MRRKNEACQSEGRILGLHEAHCLEAEVPEISVKTKDIKLTRYGL